MSPVLTWVRRVVVSLVLLGAAGIGAVYVGATMIRGRTHPDIGPVRLAVLPADAISLAEGGRLSRILGCYGGCHGTRMEGALFFSEPGVADLVAPNLSRLAPSYSDAELARAIRHGVRRDGTGLFAMPSSSFYHLSDQDLGRLIAFLRRQPREDGHDVETRIGPLGRLGIVTRRFTTVAATMDHGAPRAPAGVDGDLAARGRYLAIVACTECHGTAFEGGLEGKAPPLAIAATYTDEAFRHLMRTGETPGKRPLYLMGETARQRFSHLTDEEITALQTFLRTLR